MVKQEFCDPLLAKFYQNSLIFVADRRSKAINDLVPLILMGKLDSSQICLSQISRKDGTP